MTIQFPVALDAFTNPDADTRMDEAGFEHDLVHADLFDLLEAIEAKIGIDSSAVQTSHDYKLSGITGAFKAASTEFNSGTNTGDQTNISGNAATATALQTARTINGVSFDGTANITVDAAAGTLTGATLAAGVTASSLTSFGNSPTLVTPLLGTPTSGVLTNCTGLPVSTGLSGLAAGVAAFLGAPSSANLATAVTDETGSGALVFANSPTLVTPALGTPASGVLTNCTGLPISTGVAGLAAGIAGFLASGASADLATAVTDETGSGPLVFAASPALTGTPTAPTAAGGTNTTQIATTAFVLSELAAAVTGLLELKGGTDCSTNPNYPAASAGDAYYVTVAGKIGGASGTDVDVGDLFFASADNAGGTEAAVGASWELLEHNLVGALLAANNLSDLANADTAITNLGGAAYTGTGGLVRATSPALVTPNIGTPSAGTLTNCTGLPISTGVAGLAAGIATFLATPSSANLTSAVSGETGTGALVFANSPALVTPDLGTPSALTLTNATGLPVSTGISGLAAGIATFLGSGTSADLATAITDETGSGLLVFATSPVLTTPNIGTPSAGTLTNCTGLPEAGLSLTDITTNNATASQHGFLPKLENSGTKFLRDDGTWQTAGGATVYSNPIAGTLNESFGSGAGASLAAGAEHNAFFGHNAGTLVSTGDRNTAVGRNALSSLTTAVNCTAVGARALEVATGNSNTAVGTNAGLTITTGLRNTGLGESVINGITTANDVTAVGYHAALLSTVTCTAIGSGALDAHTSGTGNCALGLNALGTLTTAANCTAVGQGAGDALDAAGNTAIGANALSAAAGTDNTAVGYNALSVCTGADNVAVGMNAGLSLTTGNQSVLIGRLAGQSLTTTSDNVIIGYSAMNVSVGAAATVAIGKQANRVNNASNCVVIGFEAMNDANNANTVAIGYQALTDLTNSGGTENTAVGYQALLNITTSIRNTVLGNSAGARISTTNAGSNTAVGTLALRGSATVANNTGSLNTAVGMSAMTAFTSATSCAIFGESSAVALTTGSDNSSLGANSFTLLTTGTGNTALGRNALHDVATGGYNIGLGMNAGYTHTGSNTLFIGDITQHASTYAINDITIGSSQAYGPKVSNPMTFSDRTYFAIPTTAPTDGNIQNGAYTVWVDEGLNLMTFRVKYSGGTLKTATLALT